MLRSASRRCVALWLRDFLHGSKQTEMQATVLPLRAETCSRDVSGCLMVQAQGWGVGSGLGGRFWGRTGGFRVRVFRKIKNKDYKCVDVGLRCGCDLSGRLRRGQHTVRTRQHNLRAMDTHTHKRARYRDFF